MLDYVYHMTLNLLKNRLFGIKTSKFSHLYASSGLTIYCMTLYQSQTRRHVITIKIEKK